MAKRSKGVMIFGILFILGAVIGVAALFNLKQQMLIYSQFTKGILPQVMIALNVIKILATLIAGIFLLKLKNWARKLVVALCLVSIVFVSVGFVSFLVKRADFDSYIQQGFAMQQDELIKSTGIEDPVKAQAQLDQIKAILSKVIPIFVMVVIFLAYLWNVIILYFFTRPQVRAQFVS